MGKQKMSIAVAALKQVIANEIAAKCEHSSNIYVELESRITEYEINAIIARYENSAELLSKETLQPFIQLLAARWERVKGTAADYDVSPNSFANVLCTHIAHVSARNSHEPTAKKVSHDEAMSFCVLDNQRPSFASEEERERKLRTECAKNLSKLFHHSAEMISFMTDRLKKEDWPGFMSTCHFDALKTLFLGPGCINSKGSIYKAITDLATDDKYYDNDMGKNTAKLFCLIEMYKVQRAQDPNYLGYLGWVTGVRQGRRLGQAEALQQFLIGNEDNFETFMSDKPEDAKTIHSGHLGMLVAQAIKLKQTVPADIYSRPHAMVGS